MSIHDIGFALLRLEYALAPHLIPLPEKVVMHMGKDKTGTMPYWQSGYVTALSLAACERTALRSQMSLANVSQSLLRIPWC